MEKESDDKKVEAQQASNKSDKKTNISTIVIIVVVVLVVLGAGGYFASRYFFKSRFENQTGITVDEDKDSAKYETEDGEEIEVGDSVDLPSYWPDDVPVYAEKSITTVGKNGENDYYLSFTSGSSLNEVFNWYIDELGKEGWSISSQLSLSDSSNISAEKNSILLNVIILKDEETSDTTVAITVSPKN